MPVFQSLVIDRRQRSGRDGIDITPRDHRNIPSAPEILMQSTTVALFNGYQTGCTDKEETKGPLTL